MTDLFESAEGNSYKVAPANVFQNLPATSTSGLVRTQKRIRALSAKNSPDLLSILAVPFNPLSGDSSIRILLDSTTNSQVNYVTAGQFTDAASLAPVSQYVNPITVDAQYLFNGSTWDRARGANKLATPAAGATGLSLIAAGGAGTFFRIFRIIAQLTVAGNLTVTDGTFNWTNAFPMTTTPYTFDFSPQGIVGTGAAAAVTATFTGGGNANIIVLYDGPSTTA